MNREEALVEVEAGKTRVSSEESVKLLERQFRRNHLGNNRPDRESSSISGVYWGNRWIEELVCIHRVNTEQPADGWGMGAIIPQSGPTEFHRLGPNKRKRGLMGRQ